MTKVSGIYLIENAAGGKRYVGSAINMGARFNEHKKLLRRGSHHSAHLQAAWNKYGEDVFRFEALEEWEPEFLVGMEQWWINMLRPEYNHRAVASSNLGIRFGDRTRAKMAMAKRGKKHTAEHNAKISISLMGIKGLPWTDERKETQSAARKGKPWTEARRAAQKGGDLRPR